MSFPAIRWSAASLVTLFAGCGTVVGSELDGGADSSTHEPPSITAIATGDFHTCALTSQGGVRCWGYNADGQLGGGTTTDASAPRDVMGLTTGATALFSGGNHVCAMTTSGLMCWGDNMRGQLGDSTTLDRPAPTAVAGLTSAVDLGAGFGHTCAIVGVGVAKCWGDNTQGQLGSSSNASSAVPVGVTGIAERVRSLRAGDDHTCALTEAGGVKCWGSNASGQLGNNSLISSAVPVDVAGLSVGVAAIDAGGAQTCALLTNGGVRCWGSNEHGQLGNGTITSSSVPVAVSGLPGDIAAISVGYHHACAITAGGAVRCWGGNALGQLGDGTQTERLAPVEVVGMASGVAQISASSGYHTCALTGTGEVRCWGANGSGQLGNNCRVDSSTPVMVSDPAESPRR